MMILVKKVETRAETAPKKWGGGLMALGCNPAQNVNNVQEVSQGTCDSLGNF